MPASFYFIVKINIRNHIYKLSHVVMSMMTYKYTNMFESFRCCLRAGCWKETPSGLTGALVSVLAPALTGALAGSEGLFAGQTARRAIPHSQQRAIGRSNQSLAAAIGGLAQHRG